MGSKVVLLSGGLDSSTLLGMVCSQFPEECIYALSISYGQKHVKELESAVKIAEHYGAVHISRDISSVFEFSNSALLRTSGKKVPTGSYGDASTHEEDGMSKTYVPYRNGLFLSYAGAIAYSLGADTLYYGAHADDAEGNAYPDCSLDFIEAQGKALWEGTGHKLKLMAPFKEFKKAEIVRDGLLLGVPYEHTWTCYEGNTHACGVCGTCVDRRLAFFANGTFDPTPYKDNLPNTEGVTNALENIRTKLATTHPHLHLSVTVFTSDSGRDFINVDLDDSDDLPW